MHIKSITLRGFLCYKDATTVTFHPGLNVIVGPNGSGKSSLLSGIQFAMVEPSSDKSLCLHQGAGSKMLVGYVSLVFDNSDGRLTGFDCEEVTIRRDFSAQKDEITVNGKRMTRTELLSILEAAGFSRSNPYYYAHQHEIAALARMTNVERLKVLKECAGTRVYDERRAEAVISLEETRARRATIDNTLELILKRLHELQAEHDELQQVLDIEREVNCVEALLSQKDYEVEEKKAQKIEKKYDQLKAKYSALEEKLVNTRNKLSALDEQRTADTAQLLSVKALIKENEQDVLEAKKEVERLETRCETDRQTRKLNAEVLRAKERQLSEWTEKEENVSSELRRVRKELENVRKEKEAVVEKLLELRTSARQYNSNGKSFSKENKGLRERDVAEIRSEMQSVDALYAELQSQWEAWVKEKESHLKEKSLLDEQVSVVEAQLRQHSGVLEKSRNAEETCLQKKKMLQETLTVLREQHDGLVWQIELARQKRDKSFRPAQLAALQAALRYDAERVSSGCSPEVLGLLVENIRVAPKYFSAVEAAAGPQLFNLLVKNQETAKALIPHIKASGGSLTLAPVEEIAATMQDNGDTPAVSSRIRNDRHSPPLLDVINCVSDAVAPCVRQVFGHYLLVDNCDIGREQRFTGFDCVTIAGDVVTKKKTLRGGGRPRHQVARLKCQADVWEAEEALEKHREEEKRSNAALETVQEELTATRVRIRESHDSQDQGLQELHRLKDRLRKWTARDRRLATRNEGLASSLSDVKVQRASLEKALKEAMDHAQNLEEKNHAAISSLYEEAEEARDFGKHICALEEAASLKTETIQKFEISVQKLGKIRENISARIAVLRGEIVELAVATTASEHQQNQHHYDVEDDGKPYVMLERSRQMLQELEEKWRALGEQRERILKSQKITEKRRMQLEDEAERVKRDLDLLNAEMSLVREASTSARLRCENLTAKLKSIPGSFKQFDQYSNSSYQELESSLETLNKNLRAYSAVNRKALDQFARFSAEEKRLVLQQEELRKSEKAIVHLITSLDNQKDATLIKTFENVNLQFGMVFDAIVPGGKAKLILKTAQKPAYFDSKGQNRTGEELSVTQPLQADEENMCEAHEAQAVEEDEREVCDDKILHTSSCGDALQSVTETVILESPTIVDQCIMGMAIKVRFPATRRYVPLESLSGGQKSAVALALMFALQRVESAPFYALDEIDANLDPQYRGAVAQLVQKQSQNHQIIVISHKSQMVQAGDWFLEAQSSHQVATVVPTSRVDALALIEVQWAGIGLECV